MIRPTFLSFETAKRALTNSQLGLDTVGHNIANINTPGYTRQRVDQVSISSGGYKAKYQAYGVQFPGQGSDLTGISQIRDPFLDKRYRDEAAKCGEQGVVSNGLAEINAIFDEITNTGSHAKMGEFLGALDKLIATADSKEHASVLRNKAKQVAQVLNKNMSDLNDVQQRQQNEMRFAVEDVNNILERIAMLNGKIKEDNFYGNPSNELNDERNLLIDQLSEFVEIDVNRTPVKISEDLSIQQISIKIKGTDITLVDDEQFDALKVDFDAADGKAAVHLVDSKSGLPIMVENGSSDISGQLFTGALKGYMDVLNGKGVFSGNGESGFRGIPYYKECLDDYARTLADTMNNLNRIEILDDNNDSFVPPAYVEMPLFSPNDGSDTITAENISVSKAWLDNEGHINASMKNGLPKTSGGNLLIKDAGLTPPYVASSIAPADIAGVNADGYLIDADGNRLTDTVSGNEIKLEDLFRVDADGNEAVPGESANDNLTTMKLALTNSDVSFSNGFKGSFQQYLVNFQSDMALDLELTDALLSASYSVLSGLADSRDAVSAVSIDEEGINMMTFQNYYNAAARYMTTLDEALGTIIQSMGVVGR